MFLDKGYIFVTVALCSRCTSRLVVMDFAFGWDGSVAKTTKVFLKIGTTAPPSRKEYDSFHIISILVCFLIIVMLNI